MHYQINKVTESLSELQTIQILSLVEENSNEISVNVFKKGDSVDEYMTMRELVKTNLYLQRINVPGPKKTDLIVAEGSNGIILGYILFHSVLDNPFEISIIHTIVLKEYRQQGILKNMMSYLMQNYHSISLSCFINKVDIYLRLGFSIECNYQTQIGMCYGECSDSQVVTIDEGELYKYDAVYNTLEKLKANNVSWETLLQEVNRNNNDEVQLAQEFFQRRQN